jgi:hypothetical protein
MHSLIFKILYGRYRWNKILSMTTPEQTENKIDRMVSKVGVSEQGNEWLKTCLDPFSDVQFQVDGYPDMKTGNSIVQKVKKTLTISRALGSLPDANWDCHLFFGGTENVIGLKGTQSAYGLGQTMFGGAGQTGGVQVGGLNVALVQSGIGPTITATDVKANLCPDDIFFQKGTARIIAKGFEVHNTTAELQKQGAVIVWRTPDTNFETIKGMQNGGSGQTPVSVVVQAQVPHSPSEAITLPGSKQWEASEGCYVTAVMSDSIEPETITSSVATVQRGLMVYDDPKLAADRVWFPTVIGDLNAPVLAGSVLMSQYNNCGALFTGLSSQTSLQVTVHWFIERFPSNDNQELIVLARPSPAYDPQVLELYSRTAINLPTGTMVKNNDLGSWIKQVADTLQDFGVPGMPLVKGAVSLVQAFGMKGGKGKTNEINKIKNLEKRILNTEKKIERKPRQQQLRIKGPVDSRGGGHNTKNVKLYSGPLRPGQHRPKFIIENKKKKKPFNKKRGKKEFNV